jgi:hypothetical protein
MALCNDNGDVSSGKSEEEVSLEESMNQPDSYEDKLMRKHASGSDGGDISSTESESRPPP